MRINTISNHNYTPNNNKQNFKGLYFKEKTIQTIAQNCSMAEIKILKAAAEDKINLKTLLHSDVTNPIREHLFLKMGNSANDLRLLYEPYMDKQYTTYPANDPWGSYTAHRLYRYTLGGKFHIIGYVPPLPRYSDRSFNANGYTECADKEYPTLLVQFVDKDTSTFNVFATTTDDTEHVKNALKENGIIPNETSPIPTKEFVREIVKNVYKYLINENVKYFNIAENATEKAKLLEETEVLKQKYAAEQLGNFIYCE